MESDDRALSPFTIDVENIGGIAETRVECAPGVSVLTGRNATNRTSFLRAIKTVIGSNEVSIKGDADEGQVEMAIDGETYTRTLTRRNGTVHLDGEPYVDDAELAELFAFLLESNAARQAVVRGDDLYEVIMQPVDTEDIEVQIDSLETEREALEAELDEIGSLKDRLPELEERRVEIEEELTSVQNDLKAKRAELEELDAETGPPDELEDRLAALRKKRGDLETVEGRLQDEERIIEALEVDRDEVESELEGLADIDGDEGTRLENEIRRHRDSIQDIESTLADLQSVIQFNESLLHGEAPDILQSLKVRDNSDSSESVTDRLLEDESVVCWTCGSSVNRSAIEQTIDLLREVHSEKIDERADLREEIDELDAERKHIERTREQRRRLEQRLSEIETDLDDRRARIDDLETEAEELDTAIFSLEDEVDALETDDQEDLLALHREVTELELRLDQLTSQLEDTEDEIDAIEARVEEWGQIENQIDELTNEIGGLRSRIDRLEQEAIDEFNKQMDVVLELLEFENLERIWIERIEEEEEVKRGRRTEQQTTFDLHVVRTTATGTVYEDTIDHLSESEREVVGLVFALSGYLVHEVYEEVPIMLLDSLEAFDADRVAKLVDHFARYADYLVVALLPEDAAALDGSYRRITEI